MDVIVKEQEINFSIKGQLLFCDKIVVITSGNHFRNSFEAYLISSDSTCESYLFETASNWNKKEFKIFNGTIILKQ